MRGARLLLAVAAALAVGACARQQPAYYVMDPNTGQPVPVQDQQSYASPDYAQQSATQSYAQSGGRGLFSSSSGTAQQSYVLQSYEQQSYAQQPAPQAPPSGRGLFNSRMSTPQVYAPQPYVAQPYPPQTYAPPNYPRQPDAQKAMAPQYIPPQARAQAAPQYASQYAPQGGPYVAAPYGYASAPANGQQQTYTLDSGDKLRVVVFGQDGITNSYTVDAGGNINLPLVGVVPARGYGTQQLSQMIAERLKQGYVREPHVSVEVEAYRPFFILGEVTNPGQYPYVANMTAETAIAIAGGFAPRAQKSKVELTRNATGQQMHGDVPLGFPLRPGDTVVVKERWF
jgi:protein involved in polysaccharide export with SLBB domain